MSNPNVKTAITCFILGCFLSASALAAGNEAAIHKSRELLQAEKFSEALSSASNAVIADPNDYRGYYYKAMAEVGLGHKNEALKAIEVARRLGGASAKAALDKLQNVAQQLQGTGTVGSGDKSATPTQAQSVISNTPEIEASLILRCNYTESDVNQTEIYKISRLSWEIWSLEYNFWFDNMCKSVANVIRNCEIEPKIITVESKYIKLGLRKVRKINRVTGNYSMTTYDDNSGKSWENISGTCAPTADPEGKSAKF